MAGDNGVIGLSVGLDILLEVDIKLPSENLQSLLSTNVGADPKLPMLLTVSSTSPFSQLSAVSYLLSGLLRRDFRDLYERSFR